MEDLLKSGSQWRLLWDQLQFLSSSGLQSDWSNWEETQFFLKSKKLIFLSYVTTKLSGLVKTFMIVFWKEVIRFWENWTANSNRKPKSKKDSGITYSLCLVVPIALNIFHQVNFYPVIHKVQFFFVYTYSHCSVSNDQVLIFTESVTYFSSTIIILQLSLIVIFLFILQGTVLFRSCDSIHEL